MTPVTRDFALPLVILILCTILIAATGADLAVSALFSDGGKWTTGYLPFWQFFYKLDRTPAIALGASGLLTAIAGAMYRRRRAWILPGLYLSILLALGPGLLVNAVFKEYWGRPRPREVVQFGGTKEFLHPWQAGVPHKGRSFPSGHSSAAFYMTAPYFVLRRRNRRVAAYWLGGGLLFGILMSIARITQGGHFLSDTLWAWGMVHLLAVALYYLMRLDRNMAPPPAP